MNAKKAKLIRKLAKQEGKYSTTPDYRIAKTVKKMVYVPNEKGIMTAREVERMVVVNLNKIYYRNMKKAYVNGDLVV